MKIILLEASNIKRLRAVRIEPKGEVVIIGGDNGEGKSSTIDAIAYAMGGADLICEDPVRKGAAKGKTSVTLDNGLIITRTFTAAGGTTLTVSDSSGAKMSSPQTVLDKLVGTLTFDPLAFMRLEKGKKLATLQQIVGLNFMVADARKKKTYDERTQVNRKIKELEGQLAGLKRHNDVPEKEESVAELSAQLAEIQKHNAANQEQRVALREADSDVETQRKRFHEAQEAFAAAEKRLNEATALLVAEEKARDERKARVEKLEDKSADPIMEKIENAENINRKVRENQAFIETRESLDKARKESADLTLEIEAIDDKKREKIANAKFPVEGLGFDETGVTFNGIPFDQASGAEQLRASVAIGMSQNPELKVLLCRDGSLLDDKSLAMLSEIVKDNGYQLWLERVGDGDEAAIIIEDGMVAGATEPEQKELI